MENSFRDTEADEFDSRANWDPDRLLQCPFDPNHKIRTSRFPFHIIKCRKNHPKLAAELRTCPFNARHLVPQLELQAHKETCPDRTPEVQGEGTTRTFNWKLPVRTSGNAVDNEDWDKEADDSAPPFVLRVKTGPEGK